MMMESPIVQNNATTFMYNSWSSGGMKLKLMYCATGHIFQLSTCPCAIAPSHISLLAVRAVAELESSKMLIGGFVPASH